MWSREQRMLNVYIHSKTYQTQQPAAAHLSSHPPLSLHPHFTSLLVTHSLLSFFFFFYSLLSSLCKRLCVSISFLSLISRNVCLFLLIAEQIDPFNFHFNGFEACYVMEVIRNRSPSSVNSQVERIDDRSPMMTVGSCQNFEHSLLSSARSWSSSSFLSLNRSSICETEL